MLIPSIAAAAPDVEGGKAHFAAGKQAFERGEYETALVEFQKAYDLAPAPSLFYNMGKTYEALGRYKDAAFSFDKYLESYGPPQNDEDKQFQDNLRARIASDRGRPDRGGPQQPQQPQQPQYPQQQYPQQQYPQQQYPQQQYPQQPTYYPQQPPYGYPYGTVPPTYRITKADMLLEAHSRRNRAIALIVVGCVLDVLGIAILIDGAVNPHGDGFNINAYGAVNYAEDWLGASLIVVGITLWGPGAASFVRAQHRINQVNAMPDNTVANSGGLPQAVMFHAPVIRF